MPLIRYIIISLIVHTISFAGIDFYLNGQKIVKKENIADNKNMELIWIEKMTNNENVAEGLSLPKGDLKLSPTRNLNKKKSPKEPKIINIETENNETNNPPSPSFYEEGMGGSLEENALEGSGLLGGSLNTHISSSHNKIDLSYNISEQIRSKIERSKRYPLLARKRGIQGSSIIKFKLAENGNVDDIEILKSTGHEILDAESIETVKRASPFPYLPGWIEVPIEYKLE